MQGKRYIDINLRKLSKYEQKIGRKQQKLLSRLKSKEQRFEKSLKKKDSLSWAKLQERRLDFDSISKLERTDSLAQINRQTYRSNRAIDSLNGVAAFLQKTVSNSEQSGKDLSRYNSDLATLSNKLNHRQYINDLITKRVSDMKSIAKGPVPGLTGIEQQVYYAKAQMSSYKDLSENPNRLEEKAYEFLQGQIGFDESVSRAVNGGNSSYAMGKVLAPGNLEQMGLQTKRQITESLQKKFGNNVGSLKQNLNSQLNNWQKDALGIAAQVKETKQSLQHLKKTAKKPSFKINPIRCLPFEQRIKKSYDFQTTRPTSDGKPAMVQLGAMFEYQHTSSLSAGVGVATSFGLGQSWSDIHLSFVGIGGRTFAKWEIAYGIGAYIGYERTFKRKTFSNIKNADYENLYTYSKHNTPYYSESAFLGITKTYRINSNNSGSVQLLYDIWWKEKQLNSPFVLRLTSTF